MTTKTTKPLINLMPVTNLSELPIRQIVVDEVRKTLRVDGTLTQCVYVKSQGARWGVCLSTCGPPVVFVANNVDKVTVLGFTAHLCGPVVRMGVDSDSIHLVVSAPEGDELFYSISRRNLSFNNPHGEIVTPAHKEVLYAAN